MVQRPDIFFQSTKTYTHAQGLSCCFRQWRATDSHCRFLHGYALKVKIVFTALKLDERNWVMDFGGLKEIKQWLELMFDHKTLVAHDDPLLPLLQELSDAGGCDINQIFSTGCEAFALRIFEYVEYVLKNNLRVQVYSVEVSEHEGNSALCVRKERNMI